MRSDTDLVQAASGGDTQAFGEIVDRYRSLVCAVAYSGTGDLARSEDVAQDTFVAAWRGLAGLREPGRLKSWLVGIARNLVKSARRDDARARTEPLAADHEPPSPTPSPLDEVLDAEAQRLVARTLDSLPETYREPLVLFYREGQSVERVADALELSEDAVKQRLARGRQMLRAEVTEIVERTLARTRPGKAFTLAVLAALPAVVPSAALASAAAQAAEGSAAAKGAAAASIPGAVLGPLLGVAGAYVGARASIENTRSPRERRFMVAMTWAAVAVSLAFVAIQLAGLLLLPSVFATLRGQLVIGGVYAALLVVLITRINRRQRRIRVEDGTAVDNGPPPARMTPGAIAGSLAGGIFGSLCWMPIMAFIASDHAIGILTILLALLLYAASVRAALRAPGSFFRISMAETAVIAAWTFGVVNWRWEAWMVAYRRSWTYEPMADLPLRAMNVLLAALFVWVFARLAQADRGMRG